MTSQPLAKSTLRVSKEKTEEVRNDHFSGETYQCAEASLTAVGKQKEVDT